VNGQSAKPGRSKSTEPQSPTRRQQQQEQPHNVTGAQLISSSTAQPKPEQSMKKNSKVFV
jgi:hypothetical protein